MSFIGFLWKGPLALDNTPYSPDHIEYQVSYSEDNRTLEEIKNDTKSPHAMHVFQGHVEFSKRVNVRLKNPEALAKAREIMHQFVIHARRCGIGTVISGVCLLAFGSWKTITRKSLLFGAATLISILACSALAYLFHKRANEIEETRSYFDFDPFEEIKLIDDFRRQTIEYGLSTMNTAALYLRRFSNKPDEFFTPNEKKLLWKDLFPTLRLDQLHHNFLNASQPKVEWEPFIQRMTEEHVRTTFGAQLQSLASYLRANIDQTLNPEFVKSNLEKIEPESLLMQTTLTAIKSSSDANFVSKFVETFSKELSLTSKKLTELHTLALFFVVRSFFKRDSYKAPFDFTKAYSQQLYWVTIGTKIIAALKPEGIDNPIPYLQFVRQQFDTIPNDYKKLLLSLLPPK